MSLTARRPEGGDFKSVPPGTHPARCIGLVDLGFQEEEWKGEKKTREQVWLSFELPNETIERDGVVQPMIIGTRVTNILLQNSKLYKWLTAWRGKEFSDAELEGFRLPNILGTACMLTVVENQHGKAKIEGIGKMIKGLQLPQQHNSTLCFELPDGDAPQTDNTAWPVETVQAFQMLPEFLQNIIHKRVPDPFRDNGAGNGNGSASNEPVLDDDIPF